MYIRITRNARGDAYYHLVESYREDGKVKQRTLLSLGKVGEGKLEQLARALEKYIDSIYAINLSSHIDVKDTYIVGPLLVLEKMMEDTGICGLLEQINNKHTRLRFNLRKVIFSQLASRFIKPVSKLGLYDRWLERLYPEMVDHNIELQHIYRSLDILAMHKDQIESSLFSYKKNLFNLEIDVVLYDLTTLRFESTRTDLGKLRKFGYSKEMRSDCTQVVFGLLTDLDGIPLGFEVYPGNTFEGKTLEDIVNKIRKKFTVRRFIFVADRGLFSSPNLNYIKKDKGEFIVGFKMGKQSSEVQTNLYDLSKYKYLNEKLAVYETQMGDDRCVVTWSQARSERDKKTREDILDKIRNKLTGKATKSKSFITNTNYKKYLVVGDSGVSLNQEAILKESAKDGFFGIITNVKNISSEEIVIYYKQLWKIEDAFGEIKGNLKTRPVFHWTDHRIVGHLTLCFLCYLCEAHLTKALREHQKILESKAISKNIIDPRDLTVTMAMEELSRVMAIPVKIKSQTIWARTDIPKNALKLIQAIKMKIPPKILKTTKQM
jgi:transposase